MAAKSKDKESLARIQALVSSLVATEETEVIKAAELMLRHLLRCAVQSGHSRRFPELTKDAVDDSVRRAIKKGKKR